MGHARFDDSMRGKVYFNLSTGFLEFRPDDNGPHLISKVYWREYLRAKATLFDLQEGIASRLRETGQESPDYTL